MVRDVRSGETHGERDARAVEGPADEVEGRALRDAGEVLEHADVDSTAGIGPMAIAVLPDMRERLFWVSSMRRPASLSSGRASSETKG